MQQLTRPVVAGFIYNFVIIVTHLLYGELFNRKQAFPLFHSPHSVYLFLMDVDPSYEPSPRITKKLPIANGLPLPNVSYPNCARRILTFAGGSLYDAYDHSVRLWGIGITTDQQLAGLVMKLIGIYLWVWIAARFFQWSRRNRPEMVLVTETKEPQPS